MTDIAHRAHAWIMGGDTGVSSKTIWATMMGVPPQYQGGNHPYDPDDLGRCLRLLRAIPEWRDRLGEMEAVSPHWAALVARWDEIAGSMEREVGIDWDKGRRAEHTYLLMKEILLPADLQWMREAS